MKIENSIYQILQAASEKSDSILNKKIGFNDNAIGTALHQLATFGKVEVGYRQSCGKTDHTHFAYREWAKLLKLAKKHGLEIFSNPVKHGNAYATNKGGFWTSSIYTIEDAPK